MSWPEEHCPRKATTRKWVRKVWAHLDDIGVEAEHKIEKFSERFKARDIKRENKMYMTYGATNNIATVAFRLLTNEKTAKLPALIIRLWEPNI